MVHSQADGLPHRHSLPGGERGMTGIHSLDGRLGLAPPNFTNKVILGTLSHCSTKQVKHCDDVSLFRQGFSCYTHDPVIMVKSDLTIIFDTNYLRNL